MFSASNSGPLRVRSVAAWNRSDHNNVYPKDCVMGSVAMHDTVSRRTSSTSIGDAAAVGLAGVRETSSGRYSNSANSDIVRCRQM
ncbi:hypothetical protein C8039_19600 [Halogeometricum sp. wsp3]|nr:hypothetical protein C8039_19600 [Halogeometricum sp. wsp3]